MELLRLISDHLTLIAALLLLNWVSHIFLTRFFTWYKENKGTTGKSKWGWILYIPPISLAVAVFLVGLGLILQIFDKKKKRNAKNSRSLGK